MVENRNGNGNGTDANRKTLAAGDQICVPCDVLPGPFPGEHLVTVDTIGGAISGFIQESELERQGDQWFVRGIIRAVSSDHIQVWIRGSFMTTNGLASVPPHLARAA